MEMKRIFISYSRTDEAFARRLNNALNEIDAATWLDIQDIPGGVVWSQAIQRNQIAPATEIDVIAFAATEVDVLLAIKVVCGLFKQQQRLQNSRLTGAIRAEQQSQWSQFNIQIAPAFEVFEFDAGQHWNLPFSAGQ
jgi:hypothetical protein